MLSFDGSHAIVFMVLVWPELRWYNLAPLDDFGSVMHILLSPEAVAINASDGDHFTSKMPLL